MLEQHSPEPSGDVFGPLEGGERVMWRGRAGVAEYAFDRAASLPRWTLPETTEVLVTDRRVIYAYVNDDEDLSITSGELRWLWPQHLRLQPGARTPDRGAATTQIQMVCGGSDGSYPALVFAGGDLRTVGDADKVANVLRQAIARFRIDNAKQLGLTAAQARMLSRLLIGPEFSNHQGGPGQTVSLLGALPVSRPAPPGPAAEPRPVPAEGTRVINLRPGIEADASRAWAAARAEQATQQAQPDQASRAAELAARIAELVSTQSAEQPPADQPRPIRQSTAHRPTADQQPDAQHAVDRHTGGRYPSRQRPTGQYPEEPTFERPAKRRPAGQHAAGQHAAAEHSPDAAVVEPHAAEHPWPPEPDPAGFEVPTMNLTERAEALRRSTARFTANSAGSRAGSRHTDRDPGMTSQGRKNGP